MHVCVVVYCRRQLGYVVMTDGDAIPADQAQIDIETS